MNEIRDIVGMAVVGVAMTIVVPIAFLAACVWQLWEIVWYESKRARRTS